MSGRAIVPRCCAAALALFLCACVVVSERYVLEEPYTESQVSKIRHGETTKRDILDWLGPPAAVDDNAARFPEARRAAGVPLVYRYRATEVTFADLCAFGQGGGVCVNTTPMRKTRNLWILIDERSQRVLDHILDETEAEAGSAEVSPWLR